MKINSCPRCNKDGKEMQYDVIHDGYYCEDCNLWVEKKCSDKNCEFCFERPEFPVSKS